jgi:hypothetical protein
MKATIIQNDLWKARRPYGKTTFRAERVLSIAGEHSLAEKEG